MQTNHRVRTRLIASAVLAALFAPAAHAVTLTANFTGPSNGLYSTATNWDIGVVPNNVGPVHFLVALAPGTSLQLDDYVSSNPCTVDSLTLGDDSIFSPKPNTSFTIQLPAALSGIVDADGGTFAAMASGTTFAGDRARVYGKNGAMVKVAANAYSSKGLTGDDGDGSIYGQATWNWDLLKASGSGTLLDLSALQSIDAGYSPQGNDFNYQHILADTGGKIDLKNVQTITSPAAFGDRLEVNVSSGGIIDLSGLHAVSSAGNGRTRFVVNGGSVSMPSVQSFQETAFEVSGGGTVTVNGLSPATYSSRNMTGNDGDGSIYGQATWNWDLLKASGAGTLLDLSALTSIDAGYSPQGNDFNYQHILADTGGKIDLKNVQTITSPAAFGDRLEVNVSSGGIIDLSGLHAVSSAGNGRTRFVVNGGSVSMPSVQSFQETAFEVSGGGTVTVNGLSPATYSSRNMTGNDGDGSIYGQATWNWDLLKASGAGTLLDLSALTSIDAGYSPQGNDFNYQHISADTGGKIDLKNVQTIKSSVAGYDQLDFSIATGGVIDLSGLRTMISVGSGLVPFGLAAGKLRLGDFTSIAASPSGFNNAPVTITLSDAASEFEAARSLALGSSTTFTTVKGSSVSIGRDFRYAHTDESKVDLGSAILKLNGSGVQQLEVGGLNLDTFTQILANDNFGFGRMIVGRDTQATLVDLRDDLNNGNRATPPDPVNEALYIFGPQGRTGTPQVGDPDALELHGGSTLILHNIPAYARQTTGWVRLQDILGAQRRVAYGGGFLARTLSDVEGAWDVNSDGNWSLAANWFVAKPNAAGKMAIFGSKATAPRMIHVNEPVTVGLIAFDNANAYTIDGASAISLTDVAGERATIRVEHDNGDGAHAISAPLNVLADLELINNSTGTFTLSGPISSAADKTIYKSGTGTVLLSGPQTFAAGTRLRVDEGTFQLSSDLTGPGGAHNVSLISAGGTMLVDVARHVAGVSVTDGTIELGAGGGKVLETDSLLAVAPGKLDLTGHSMAVNQGFLPSVREALASGYDGGLWDGAGITTSVNTGNTALGYAAGNDPTIAHMGGHLYGQAFGPNAVIVKYTYMGDANLDGSVDGSDVALWAQNFSGALGANPANPRTWTRGDFNYDGSVDGSDVAIWAQNFTGALGAGGMGNVVVNIPNASPQAIALLDGIGIAVEVPEPAGLSLLALAGAATIRRRRR